MEKKELTSLNDSVNLEELSFEELEDRLELLPAGSCCVNICQCGSAPAAE
jgi:hypothetical protein